MRRAMKAERAKGNVVARKGEKLTIIRSMDEVRDGIQEGKLDPDIVKHLKAQVVRSQRVGDDRVAFQMAGKSTETDMLQKAKSTCKFLCYDSIVSES